MTDRAELTIDGSGPRPVVVKRASSGAGRRRLAHEIAVLQGAQHPGVVTVVDVHDDPSELRLTTAFCGSRTLANAGSLPVARVAGLVAALATTVADLHELGVAHGRLTADHVLVGSDGRPIVCGFAEAIRGDALAHARAGDVLALGSLLRSMLEHHDDMAPIPPARLARRGAWTGYQRRALLNLADQAAADDPALRPSARQLAHNVRATVPDATLLDELRFGDDSDHEPDSQRRGWSIDPTRPHVPLAIAALVVVAVIGAGAGLLASDDRQVGQPVDTPALESAPDQPVDHAQATSTSLPQSTTTTVPSRSSDLRSKAMGCNTSDTDGDAAATLANGGDCPVALTLVAGVLTVGDEHFDIGLDDAAIAVGDFSCDGTPQAAVLDRHTADVFVFDRWAAERPVTAHAIDQVIGGRRLLAEPSGAEPCHRLVALDQYGIRHVIPTEVRR